MRNLRCPTLTRRMRSGSGSQWSCLADWLSGWNIDELQLVSRNGGNKSRKKYWSITGIVSADKEKLAQLNQVGTYMVLRRFSAF